MVQRGLAAVLPPTSHVQRYGQSRPPSSSLIDHIVLVSTVIVCVSVSVDIGLHFVCGWQVPDKGAACHV